MSRIVALDGVTSIPYMFYLLRDLGIPSAFIVDKDYFLPYKDDKGRRHSVDAKGFPRYSSTAKSSSLLRDLFPDAEERARVVESLVSNHSEAMKLLLGVNFFCFRYSMEVDLVATPETRDRLIAHFGLSSSQTQEYDLLVSRSDAIKAQEVVLKAVSGMAARRLPYSYRSIRRELPKLISSARNRN